MNILKNIFKHILSLAGGYAFGLLCLCVIAFLLVAANFDISPHIGGFTGIHFQDVENIFFITFFYGMIIGAFISLGCLVLYLVFGIVKKKFEPGNLVQLLIFSQVGLYTGIILSFVFWSSPIPLFITAFNPGFEPTGDALFSSTAVIALVVLGLTLLIYGKPLLTGAEEE